MNLARAQGGFGHNECETNWASRRGAQLDLHFCDTPRRRSFERGKNLSCHCIYVCKIRVNPITFLPCSMQMHGGQARAQSRCEMARDWELARRLRLNLMSSLFMYSHLSEITTHRQGRRRGKCNNKIAAYYRERCAAEAEVSRIYASPAVSRLLT